MAIPPWAVEALRRGVGGVIDKVPPETLDQLKKRASDLLAELPQTAARGVDSVMRGAKAGKDSLQRWTRRHVALVTPVVNASGCLCHASVAGVPLSHEAIEVATEAFQAGSLSNAIANERLERRLNRCVESGELGILIASSVDGACLAIAHSIHQCPFYFHRSQSFRLPSGAPIPDAFGAGVPTTDKRVHEIGSVGGIDPSDVRGIGDHAFLVAVANGSDDAIWYRSFTDALSTRNDLTRIVYLPVADWKTTEVSSATPGLPAVLQTLGADADLVITTGDGALGGPRCGLIVGNKKRIEAISRSAIWPALVADVATHAAMTLTLEAIGSGDAEDVPTIAMMRTSEENLRSRAERLATRVAAEPSIRSCQITANPATISVAGPWSIPSRQLNLAHRDWSANDWAARLANEVPAVLVRVQSDSIAIDLRWIQPCDDAALVATLVGHETMPSASATD
jgi:L-seryl-tRNA(Ser) seleniumtransferase